MASSEPPSARGPADGGGSERLGGDAEDGALPPTAPTAPSGEGADADDPASSPAQRAEQSAPPIRSWVLAALVGTVAVLAYAPALGGEFIYDDVPLIANNPFVHSFEFWRQWFTTDFWSAGAEIPPDRLSYYRPLVTASYALDWALGGGTPFVFHVTNLVWHAATSVLAFYALRRWLGAAVPALVAALLFAVHPTKAESVAWIAGRTDVMCAAFLLLASSGVALRLRGTRGGLALELGATLLAYLTKETAIVLPAFVVVELWVVAGRPPLDGAFVRRALRAAAPQLAVALGYLGLRALVMPVSGNIDVLEPFTGITARLRIVLETFGRAAELSLAPHDLSVQQGLLVFQASGEPAFNTPYAIVGALFVAALVGVSLALRTRRPGIALGIAFYLATFLPTSNIALTRMTTLISERFLYVPVLGLGLVVGILVERASGTVRRAMMAVAAVAGIASLVPSLARASDYASSEAFWQRERALHPESIQARVELIRHSLRARRYATALEQITEARKIASVQHRSVRGEIKLLLLSIEILSHTTPDADHQRLRQLSDFYAALLNPRANVASVELFGARAELQVNDPRAQRLLRKLRPELSIERALLLSRLGEPAEAQRLARAASDSCPLCLKINVGAAWVLARTGDYAGAHARLDRLAAIFTDEDLARAREGIETAQHWAETAARSRGAAALHARAMERATLELYDQAYRVLEPHTEAIRPNREPALGVAEMAWRAGRFDAARHLLKPHLSPEGIRTLTRVWSEKMGWVEAAGD